MMAKPSAVTTCQSAPLFKISPLRSGNSKRPPVMGMMRRLPRSFVSPSSQTGATRSTVKRVMNSSCGFGGSKPPAASAADAICEPAAATASAAIRPRTSFDILIIPAFPVLFLLKTVRGLGPAAPGRTGSFADATAQTLDHLGWNRPGPDPVRVVGVHPGPDPGFETFHREFAGLQQPMAYVEAAAPEFRDGRFDDDLVAEP